MTLAGGNAVAAAQMDRDDETEAPALTGPGPLGVLVRPVQPMVMRLPLMERLVDGWPEAIAATLAKAWGISLVIERGAMRTMRMPDHVEQLAENALLGVVNASSAPDEAILAFDREAVFMILEAVLGGAGREQPEAAMKRRLTLIELSLMQPALGHVLDALAGCLAPAGDVRFAFARWAEDRAKLDLPEEGGGALILPLSFSHRGRTAGLTLALPLAMLEPMRAALAGVYPGEALGADAGWRRHMAEEIGRARTRLVAVLHEAVLPLSAVRALAVGETLMFDVPTDPVIEVRSGAVRLGAGRLGRANGHVAVRFETPVAAVAGEPR